MTTRVWQSLKTFAVRILADQDVWKEMAVLLRALGHDVVPAGEAGLDAASDTPKAFSCAIATEDKTEDRSLKSQSHKDEPVFINCRWQIGN